MNPWTLLLTSVGWILVGVLYLATAVAVGTGAVVGIVFARLQLAELRARRRPEPEDLPEVTADPNRALLAMMDLEGPTEPLPEAWIVRVDAAPQPLNARQEGTSRG